jgi:hypothetical protein
MVQVEVEVFETPLDYNLLLGRRWIDSMRVIVSTLFHVVRFPHQGKVVTIDQLAFFNSDTHTGNIPFISKTSPSYENVSVGLLKDSSLMGTFPMLHLFRHLGEQIRGACMPSWVLLSRTAVEERVRERKTKL